VGNGIIQTRLLNLKQNRSQLVLLTYRRTDVRGPWPLSQGCLA